MQGWETLSSTRRKNRETTLAGKDGLSCFSLPAQGVRSMLQRVNEGCFFLFFLLFFSIFIYLIVSLSQFTVLRLQLCIVAREMKAMERISSFVVFIRPRPDHP